MFGVATSKIISTHSSFLSMKNTQKGHQDKKPLTVSILPARILSVVAAILPPPRCRSHSTVRRSICGNICNILSAAASLAAISAAPPPPFTPRCLLCAARPPAASLLPAAAGDEKKRYRTMRPDSRRMTSSEGMLTCSFAMAASLSQRRGGSVADRDFMYSACLAWW